MRDLRKVPFDWSKWVEDRAAGEGDWSQVHGLSLRAAKFWIGAFVEEVESRARLEATPDADMRFMCGMELFKLVREFELNKRGGKLVE